MRKLLIILILQNFGGAMAPAQSFTAHDLVTLASLPSKNVSHFMSKNGFVLHNSDKAIDTVVTSFIPKIKAHKNNFVAPERSIDLYEQNDTKSIILHVSSLSEYLEDQQSLIKSRFVYDKKKDISKEPSMLFQKDNITIETVKEVQDSTVQYSLKLKAKKIPDSIAYAEDLLQFDSHEFLVSYFGEKNVKKDLYYLSEKELKRCSVLFNGTRHQVVFVWGDEDNLNNLSYILVSNVLPTEGGKRNASIDGNNEWKCQNGIHSGMPIRDLLKLNDMDFDIYGNKSELAFMVKPGKNGKVNFKKTAILLNCSDCFDDQIFDQPEVSALDIAKANLHLNVADIILYP